VFVLFSPLLKSVSAQTGPSVVVSELRFRGVFAADEFIELFNPTSEPVNVGGWTISGSDGVGNIATRAVIPDHVTINSGCYYLITRAGDYSGSVPGDLTYTASFADAGGVAVINTSGVIADQVGFSAGSAYKEPPPLAPLTGSGNNSYERNPGGALGHADTNNNFDDFQLRLNAAAPQNSQSSCIAVLTVYYPHEVQGSGPTSPKAGSTLTVRGVVTAVTGDGFFMQTETSRDDFDPSTSNGLFVETSAASAVGHVMQVKGTVVEAGGETRLRDVTRLDDLGGPFEIPAAVVLTSIELSPGGPPDQLERFEGMRVTAPALMSISGTSLDGSFYAVLGSTRPFREAGIEVGAAALPCALPPCNLATFDGNPERLRVDSNAVLGTTAVNLSSLAAMNNVTGPLQYASNAYTLLPETTLSPAGGMSPAGVPAAPEGHYSVASMNFGNDSVPMGTRVAKAALMVNGTLNRPDVIAVQNAGDAALSDLAAQLGGYTPVLGGFLVKTDRVTVEDSEVLDGAGLAFDRPSLKLRVIINGGLLVLPQRLTLIASELRSLDGVGGNDDAGAAAREQRRAQAEFVATKIQDELATPNQAVISLGNYNAFQFNDGYVDVAGTVAGTPAPGDQVVLASPDVYAADLANLTDTLPAGERYSMLSNGNAQSLDHMLIAPSLVAQFVGLAHARVNADFPQALEHLASTDGRLSDRDPAVAYFTFPPDVDAPVFDHAPQDVANEATSAEGAVVNYDAPTATDNLDAEVPVSCEPASGSLFPLGNTGVLCSSEDAAGNTASAWFTVTVQDTTPPKLTVPENITAEADSPAGKVVLFQASASDAVTAVPNTACTPASGSTFALGTTTVNCQASDDAGNSSAASFTVTIVAPAIGGMTGSGEIGSGNKKLSFEFEVTRAAAIERGWLAVTVANGSGGTDTLQSIKVTYRRFSNSGNEVLFSGEATWNGLSGYRFTAAAHDATEHGRGTDALAIVVLSPSGKVVLWRWGFLTSGNVEAHAASHQKRSHRSTPRLGTRRR
jgi:predicted extracellular nuclease